MKRKITGLILALCALALFAGCAGEVRAVDGPRPTISIVRITDAPESSVVLAADSLPERLAARENEDTVAWLTDTQYYSRSFPDTFFAMTRFLRDNAAQMRIKYIVHTGDLVHNYDDDGEWRVASDAMALLSDIPHGVLAGNHDVGGSKENYGNYSLYFGKDRFKGAPYYGGGERDNRSHYDLIELCGTPFVFVYLGYSPDTESMAFANRVFSEYPDRVGVLCVHEYLDTDGSIRKIGQALSERVVAPNPNVYLVLCGHRYTSDWMETEFDDDGDGVPERTVYQIISNYQSLTKEGGSGYLRVMRIDPGAGVLRMFTYSPVLRDFNCYDEESWRDEYTLPIPWKH